MAQTDERGESPHHPRRAVLGSGLGLLVLGAGRRTLAADVLPPDLLFDVARKGSRIGSVRVRFRADGAGFAASTAWDLAVKLAFVTVYAYRQDADDRWRGGRLVPSGRARGHHGEQGDPR